MNPSLDEIKKKVWTNAKERNWVEVIKLYKEYPEVQTEAITRSGDTALRMAIADEQVEAVEKLVGIVRIEALRVQNKLGNTPLHLAAYQGSARLCHCIANQDIKLMGIRNRADQTPIYVSALHGKKPAFLTMHRMFTTDDQRKLRNAYCKRKDGRNILHSAISGEYFDLAFQIIHFYPNLVNRFDDRGFLPLHHLAMKPSIFRSGCPRGILHKLIYDYCIHVKKLKEPQDDEDNAKNSQTAFPLNLQRLRNNTWVKTIRGRKVQKQDAEDPPNDQKEEEQSLDMVPCRKNATHFGGLSLVISKGMGAILWLITLLIGYHTVRNIIEEKKKHTWSVQIMEKLLDKSRSDCDEYGGNAYPSSPKKDAAQEAKDAFGDGDKTTAAIGTPQSERKDAEEVANDDAPVDGRRSSPDMTTVAIESENVGQRPQPEQRYGIAAKGKKDEAAAMEKEKKKSTPLVETKQGITEMVEKIIEAFGLTIKIQDDQKKKHKGNAKKESPLLVAAKNGIQEMVQKILERVPVAIHDVNTDEKNIVLLAVENRQPHIYQFLLDRNILRETILYKTDKDGNSALHLAAVLFDARNWNIPGPALHMQWEIKWYQFVENSTPPEFFVKYNEKGETAWDVFQETHKDLVCNAGGWLSKTSDSCSVVSILIATVAFAAYATVPGGINSDTGAPVLEREAVFHVFAISSLIALCFSISSVVMFLVFFTSRYREKDFATNLPTKLLVELTSLMIAVAALLVSFCAAHSFVIRDNLKYTALPLYAATLIPVVLYASWQIPTYLHFAIATYRKKPYRIYNN